MQKKKFIIIAGVIGILIIIVLITLPRLPKEQLAKVNIITEKVEYEIGNIIKINVENKLDKSICFSSCYPYYLEKKNEEWEVYSYANCSDTNSVGSCIEPGEISGREIGIPQTEIVKAGLHRLAVPVCVGCNAQDEFREDQWFYSNEFSIK